MLPLLMSNPEIAKFASTLRSLQNMPWNFTRFPSQQSIIDYIADPDYMTDATKPGICYGFTVVTTGN